MTRILLLLPSRTYRTADFLAAADRLGVDVVVGAERRSALEAVAGGGTIRVDLDDPERGVETIEAYARARPLDAVVGVDDGSTVVAAAAAERLGLRHNPPAAVERSRDKALARHAFAEAGLPTPAFATHPADLDPVGLARLAAAVRFPCVVKPLDRAASQGVIRADDPMAFAAAFRRVAAIVGCEGGRRATNGGRRPTNGGRRATNGGRRPTNGGGPATNGGRRPTDDGRRQAEAVPRLLVEDFIPGAEVAVEGLLRGARLEVLALFDKPDPLDGPFFEETLYVTPSRLSPERQRTIETTVARATRALGLAEGPIHAEVRLSDDRVWVLEIAARSIGGLCARTLRFGAGISLEELILRHAAGLTLPPHRRERTAAGVLMLPIRRSGRLREVRGEAAARSVPGIEGVQITIARGTPLLPLPEGDRYLGFMFARAASPAAVEAALREAWSRLEVVVDDDGIAEAADGRLPA